MSPSSRKSPQVRHERRAVIELLESRIAPASANLSLGIEAPESSKTGDQITYVVTITNAGPDPATDVVLTDEFASGAKFVSTTASQGSATRAGDTVTAALGTLASGASATLRVVVSAPTTPELLTNHAAATSAVSDPDPSDNEVTADTKVLRPGDLVVTALGSRTAQALIDAILGTGVKVSNVQYTGNADSSGTFIGPSHILGFDKGIVLSSGQAVSVVGPNTSSGTTGNNALPGDSDLDTLTSSSTADATVLEFDFIPKNSTLSFQYVFASEEYNEFANSSYNDVFGFFVNGTNVALLPGTATPVAINNVNGGNPLGTNAQRPEFYVNNSDGLINTQMDGMTVVFSVQATVNVGEVNHIKLAIADTGDSSLDSNVFIRGGSFTDKPTSADLAVTLSKTPQTTGVGLNLTYTAKVTNKGPSQAFGVLLTDLLPPGVDLVSATSSQGTTSNNSGNVVTNLGTLSKGTSATVTLVVTPTMTGTFPLTANVASSVADSNPANNSATANINVQEVHPIVVGSATGSKVQVLNSLDGSVLQEFSAFGGSYKGGVRVATGDVNGDGVADIIAGVGTGGKGRVRVFDGTDGAEELGPLLEFRPFGAGYLGGVYVAAGDVNGDGKADLIVSTGAGSAAEVRVFDLYDGLQKGQTPTLLTKFKIDAKVNGGVRVAAGDLDGDGSADIVVTTGINADVRVYHGDGTPFAGALGNFKASPRKTTGLAATIGDFDGDGQNDLALGAASGAGLVHLFRVTSRGAVLEAPVEFEAFNGGSGVRLAVADVDGDGIDDLAAVPGPGGGDSLKFFSGLTRVELLKFNTTIGSGGLFLGA